MRKRTASEKRKHMEKHNDGLLTNEENLNESEIDENVRANMEYELDNEYYDFPDPCEYLIGFFASKGESLYKYKNTYQNKTANMTASPKKRPPVSQNYMKEGEPKALYKSYYNCKKPSKPQNVVVDINNSLSHSSKSKYKENAALTNSYEKPNIFNGGKSSLDYSLRYSKTIDNDDRL